MRPEANVLARTIVRLAEAATPGPFGLVERESGRKLTLLRRHWNFGSAYTGRGIGILFGADRADAEFVSNAASHAEVIARELIDSQAREQALRDALKSSDDLVLDWWRDHECDQTIAEESVGEDCFFRPIYDRPPQFVEDALVRRAERDRAALRSRGGVA